MGDYASWDATTEDIQAAKFGLNVQAGAHNLDLNDPNVRLLTISLT